MTLNERKIDFRFLVALRNVRPLELYVLNEYFIRVAKEAFSMDESTLWNKDIHITSEIMDKS